MNDIEILNAVDRLRKEPLSTENNVEDELQERKYEIDCLKEEIENLRDKVEDALKDKGE